MTFVFSAVYRLRTVLAVLIALLVGALLILGAGQSPIDAYSALLSGAFLDYWGLGSTLVKTSPILLTGLAVIIPLRAGLFNLGAEGQLYMGALFATIVALYGPELPAWAAIPLCMVAGAVGGGLWALPPAIFKAYQGTNEVILTLLLNFVAINFVSFMVSGPMLDAGAPFPFTPEIPEAYGLPRILAGTDAHFGVVVGVLLAIAAAVYFRWHVGGFSLKAVGLNPRVAEYAGMSVRRHLIVGFMVGGACAGLAGTFEVIGFKGRLYQDFSPGYGYDGIIVAFLANLNPFYAILSALFLAGLRSGANIMQRATGVEVTLVQALQGLVIIFAAIAQAPLVRNVFSRMGWQSQRTLSTVKPLRAKG